MKTLLGVIFISGMLLTLAACSKEVEPAMTEARKVDASGKETTSLDAVPEAVLAAARTAIAGVAGAPGPMVLPGCSTYRTCPATSSITATSIAVGAAK